MIELDCRLPTIGGLARIPYSSLIEAFLNLRPMNSYPWSYTILDGHGYLNSHVVSTTFVYRHGLLIIALSYLEPFSYGVYHSNGFYF